MAPSTTTITVALRAQVSGYVSALHTAAQQTQAFANTAVTAAGRHEAAFTRAGATVGGFGAAAALGFGTAVKAAADFDAQMSGVQAATRASSSELASLRQAALSAGATTVFSASQAADGITQLAKAGVSTQAILGGGLKGALDLASAGQLDVGEAAETAASAMTQFGLSGAQVPHIADLLAAGAGKAQGSVHDLGMALNQSGLVAHNTGLSIEETTGALAAMASAGLTGSDAGTSLKTMLQALTPQSKQAAEAMRRYGLEAYDSQGKFVGLTAYAAKLQAGLHGMTAEQRNATLQTIFGADAVRTASVLYQDGAKGVQHWQDAVNDSGYATQTARLQLDNLNGDLENMRGSLETAFIGTGEGAQGPLRALTQDVTALVNAYNDLPDVGHNVVLELGGIAAAVGTTGGAFLLLLPRIAATRAAFVELQTAAPGLIAAFRGFAGLAGTVTAVALAAQGFSAIGGHFADAPKPIGETAKALQDLASTGQTTGALAAMGKSYADLGKQFDAVDASGPEKLGHMLKGLVDPINTGRDLETYKRNVHSVDEALTELVQSGHADQAAAAVQRLGINAKVARGALPDYTQALYGAGDAAKAQTSAADAAAQAQKDAAGSAAVVAVATGRASAEQRKLAAQYAAAADAGDDAASAGKKLQGILDDLGGNTSAERAMIGYKNAVDAVGKSLKENGRSTSDNTAKGRANLTAVLDAIDAAGKYGQAVADQKDSVEAGRKAYAGRIADLRSELVHMGLSRAEVNRLIAAYGKVPRKVSTTVSANGAGGAKAQVDGLTNGLKGLPPFVQTTVSAKDNATGILDSVRHEAATMPRTVPLTILASFGGSAITSAGNLKLPAGIKAPGHADGGLVRGPGGPRDDLVPALLSDGEFVVNAASTSRHRGLLEALNAGRYAAGGLVRRLAAGGAVNTSRIHTGASLDRITVGITAATSVATDAKQTAAAVARAAAEVVRLQTLWQSTADAIDAANRRTELQGDLTKALAAQRKAAGTKDKGDDGTAAQGVRDARKALHDYDADQRRSAQQRRNDAHAQHAQDAADARAHLEDNRRGWAFDHKSAQGQLAELNARMKHEQRYSDQWIADAQQREQITQAQAEAAQKIKDNRAAWQFDHESAQQQLADLDARMGRETKFSDQWVADAQQREQIAQQMGQQARQDADQAQQDQQDAQSKLNDLLDQRQSILDQLAAAQATYAQAVADASAKLADQTAQAKAARVEALASADLTKHATVAGAISVAGLLRNASSQVQQLQEFSAALAQARAAGVSEDAITALGLDDPAKLGQLRQVNRATADQVQQLNALVAARRAAASSEVDVEAAAGVGTVGAAIASAQQDYNDAIATAHDALTKATTDLNGQLAVLGVDTGRSYVDSIAQGMASGLPGVLAAVQTLSSAATTAAAKAAAVPAGYATGGLVTGPGGPRDDAVLARLSAGEFVVNASATAQHRSLLEAVNVGRFATGGYVSAAGIPVVRRGSDGAALTDGLLSVELQQRRTVDVLEAIYDRLGLPVQEVRSVVVAP